jgi:hypothetical protein
VPLASTFMDLDLGLDIHFEIVPVLRPTPIPNPCVGELSDQHSLLHRQLHGQQRRAPVRNCLGVGEASA